VTEIRIVQITIEVDGQLCYAKIPEGIDQIIIRMLKDSATGSIQAIKLPESWKKVTLKEAMA
jgi:hypothetical protein